MNYDQQHERVTQDLSDSVNQQQKFQERLEKIVAMREAGKTLQEISDEVGVTRQRVEQLLRPLSIEVPLKARRQKRRQAVAEWAENNPSMSCQEGSKMLGCSAFTIRRDLKALGIKRDAFAIQSAAMTRVRLNGRVELTKELLTREYLTNNLSTPEISRKYRYRQSSVMRRLQSYGIRKDRAVVNAQIRDRRKGKHLIDGRFV